MTTNNAVNTYIVPTTNNEVTKPSQPAFLGYLPSNDLNATGDGTVYTIGGTTALTEVFDQNSDFNTNGTFTAPVTGRMCLAAQLLATGGVGITVSTFSIVTSNRTYRFDGGTSNASTNSINGIDTMADMDAADTATATFACTDGAGKVMDIRGSGNAETYFSGCLVV